MVLAAFAEKGPPPPKEEVHWRVLSVIGFAVIHGGLSLVGNAPHLSFVVRVAADHDGVVPGRPGEGTIVTNVVLDIANDGALEDPMER